MTQPPWELVPPRGVQRWEDARNLTSLRARRRSSGGLEQPPGGRRRKDFSGPLMFDERTPKSSQKKLWRCAMPHDSRNVSEKIPTAALGSLKGCLVEGDPYQRRCERRVRRRSLIVSIFTQAVVVALLVLLPLFGRTEHIALALATPIPPYSSYKGPSHDAGAPHPHGPRQNICHLCFTGNIPPTIPTHDISNDESGDPVPDGAIPGIGGGSGGGLIPIQDGRNHVPPPAPDRQASHPSIVRMTQLDPAMLTHRVEPVYPPLPRQMHREGRVELHAIIATDGSIKSLEVVGGDPLFYQSALDAVSQWHYKPTILNGQPMEIDTHISVIYTMPH